MITVLGLFTMGPVRRCDAIINIKSDQWIVAAAQAV